MDTPIFRARYSITTFCQTFDISRSKAEQMAKAGTVETYRDSSHKLWFDGESAKAWFNREREEGRRRRDEGIRQAIRLVG